MKQVITYLIILILGASVAHGQSAGGGSFQISFQDSVRIVLENTKNLEAIAVGAGISTVWTSIGLDQQEVIRKQARLMKKKGYKIRPHLVNYYGALADAINIENIDATKLKGYLRVAGQIIENENLTNAANFFKNSREFFQHHALHYEKSFRLYVRDDDYHFDYIAAIPEVPLDNASDTTAKVKNPFDQFDKPAEQAQTTFEDPPLDTVPATATPFWMQPVPQPELTGGVIRFDKVTLNFSTSYDSASLKNTKGSVSLQSGVFVGDGGSFDWSTAGLGADSVYYELKGYNFNIKNPVLKADQGKLTYVGRLNGKVEGIFEFKSLKHNQGLASYPRFMSFQSDIPVLGLSDEKLKYTGGFALNGKRIYSTSVSGDPAMLEVTGDTDKKFKAYAKIFEFQDSLITSRRAQVILYQENDSIFHPGLQLQYQTNKKILTLQKDKGSLKDAPLSSSFFNVDFASDRIRWDLKSDSLNFFTTGGGSQAPMIIESVDFYDPEDYVLLSGKGFPFHPLALVANHSIQTGQREFYADDLAVKLGKRSEEIRPAMEFLSQKGMIGYNPSTGLVRVKDKTVHFFDASKNETDYDNLKIHSIQDGPANATINLKKGYMTVRGVEEFKVSDSLNVMIKPDSSVITLLKDRDIKFNGQITAGNFEINGKDFMLKYDSFFINLNHIDSIRFYITETNARGQTSRRRINNAMVGADSTAAAEGGLQNAAKSSGTLFISRPDNKSGKVKIPNYPRLDASAGGVIYFDRQEVLDGAYDRSVFFVVPPFKLDSLNDADPGSLSFEGTFVSSGMFPSFKEKLHTMSDKSLGFDHTIPTQGYALFKGDGKGFGQMNLDNSGLRMKGRIDYLAATVQSEDFLFYPDSVIAKGNVGELKEKQVGAVWFPQATLGEYDLKWIPKQDQFNLKNLRDPFNLYNTTAQLDGTLTVSKKGVTGDGKLLTKGSESISKELSFSAKDFAARHAEFKVNTTNPDKPALAAEDVRLKFNLEKNYADISPEIEGSAALDFPYAQFKTSIPTARWDLNTQKITMEKGADVPIENSYFYTTRKDLDSLVFSAEKAEYDIQSQQMKVSGIPYIVVADAKITPENNEVLILENAKIGQLKNTTIVMDTLNGYHRLTQGVVDIVSRKMFSGYATYQYVNAVNDTFAIKMTDFHLEAITPDIKVKKRDKEISATQQTVANGAVIDKDKLILAPRIFYKGDMVMYATKPALQLRGFVKLDIKTIKNYNTWIRYEQSGDEKEVYLDFDHAVTEEGGKVEAGLHFATDNDMYITFVFDKKNPDDDDFFLPSGSLFFDKESGEFRIEDRLKASGEKLSGKVFAYNEEKQEVRFEGPVNFFKNLKDFAITASALGSGNLETNNIRMNSFVMADMNVPAQALQYMALQLQDVIKNESVEEGLGDHTELLYKIADIVGEKTVKDYEERSLQNYVSLSLIPQLAQPALVFSQVNLKWSQAYKAFYSEGKLGLSNISRNDINGAFEGFMELRRNEDGSPVFHVFFKASPEAWYYFGYEDNRLMMYSSNPAFNDVISKKTNAGKAKVGELVFIPGSEAETLAFINRFRQNYNNLEAPYTLESPTVPVEEKTDAPRDRRQRETSTPVTDPKETSEKKTPPAEEKQKPATAEKKQRSRIVPAVKKGENKEVPPTEQKPEEKKEPKKDTGDGF